VQLKQELAAARARWSFLTLYQKFEHAVVLILTGLIGIVIVFAVWNLMLKIVLSIVVPGSFDPTDYSVFQAIFGMIFTVIIALEFKRSLLVLAERRDNVVQVRNVILIALLAVVRKLLILDVATTEAVGARGGDPGARRGVLAVRTCPSANSQPHDRRRMAGEPSQP
jgi:uncharacterized membrane protein (DUF373 family)